MKRLLILSLVVLVAGCHVWRWDTSEEMHPDDDNYYRGYRNINGEYISSGGYYRRQEVTIPNSYHLSNQGAPRSHHARDTDWVKAQNPDGYTVELSEGDNAANVANTLAKTPKLDRAAQVKYKNGDKTYYRGVYGSYSSREEAQKALQALPENVRNQANIKGWSQVQQGLPTSTD